MMKKTIMILLIFLICILTLPLSSCKYFGFMDPAFTLEGTWTIIQKPATWEPHTTYRFLSDAAAYQILDSNGAVFESGPVTNLTEFSFNYTMEQYDYNEALVGSVNYVEYSLAGVDTITMTFYADSEKSGNFGTITAARQ